jgi:hypothetical protein
MLFKSSRDGATPIVPMNGNAGMRIPGMSCVVAEPPAVPSHQERIGEGIPQKPEPGRLQRESEGPGNDLQDVDDEQVTDLGALDEHRPGQGVDDVRVRRADIVDRRPGCDLAVDGIPTFHYDLVPRSAVRDRSDVGMPSVVADIGLLGQWPRAVDVDLMDGHLAPPWRDR